MQVNVEQALNGLPAWHREDLLWFNARRGSQIGWPTSPSGRFLASRPKGIYKPKGSPYALSVRQTLQSRYDDQPVKESEAGEWEFRYYQEQLDPQLRDAQFTNRAMLRNQRDRVPVAVLKQEAEDPVRYRVLGLAFVDAWENGYFHLRGFSTSGTLTLNEEPTPAELDERQLLPAKPQRVLRNILARRGQPQFRKLLLATYESRCIVTGCPDEAVLEAAHIDPYSETGDNSAANGLLLRADVHTLFDLGLVAIEPDTLTLRLAPALMQGSYASYEGIKLDPKGNPSHVALRNHWNRSVSRWLPGRPLEPQQNRDS